jgi:hypothetical protein
MALRCVLRVHARHCILRVPRGRGSVPSSAVCDAGVQKNVGPAGLAVVIVREDLLGAARPECPTMCSYTTMAESDSMYNTPPCWTVYVCGLVFKKLLREGGLSAMEDRNNIKARSCLPRPHTRASAPNIRSLARIHAHRCLCYDAPCSRLARCADCYS